MTELETLAWSPARARSRTDAERARVARYIVDLVEPLAGTELVVGLSPDCELDVLNGCVVQRQPPDEASATWLGRLTGNIFGDDEGVAYSVVLFPFLAERRVFSGRPGDDGLRWFSAMWEDAAVKVWDTGSHDEWGEWDSVQHPLDVIAEDEVSTDIRDALARLGLDVASDDGIDQSR